MNAKKGTPLFGGTRRRWQLNAYLESNWWAYTEGYRDAAEHLGRAMSRSRRPRTLNLDAVVIPILFLWRQYLELRLKAIVVDASPLLGRSEVWPHDHKLPGLWRRACPLLEKTVDPLPIELERVAEVVSAFDAVDRESMAFRYPDSSPPHGTLVNIPDVTRRMKRVADFLDMSSDMIGELRKYIPREHWCE